MSHFGRNTSVGGWCRKVILHMKGHKNLVGNFSLPKVICNSLFLG